MCSFVLRCAIGDYNTVGKEILEISLWHVSLYPTLVIKQNLEVLAVVENCSGNYHISHSVHYGQRIRVQGIVVAIAVAEKCKWLNRCAVGKRLTADFRQEFGKTVGNLIETNAVYHSRASVDLVGACTVDYANCTVVCHCNLRRIIEHTFVVLLNFQFGRFGCAASCEENCK